MVTLDKSMAIIVMLQHLHLRARMFDCAAALLNNNNNNNNINNSNINNNTINNRC